MKTPDDVLTDVRRRLNSTWHNVIAAEIQPPLAPATDSLQQNPWPHAFPLGTPNGATLAADFAAYQQATLAWRAWTAAHELTLQTTTRTVHGTRQDLPTHVIIPNIDDAAAVSGHEWPTRIHRARSRGRTIHHEFAHLADLARAIRDTDTYRDIDFDLLVTTAQWFAVNSAAGLTPRQVPVPGLHAKWLTNRHRIVACLAGVADLQLLPPHPPRIHFTYLDPDHRSGGGRWHDSATVGDPAPPQYRPSVVVISENKDTALHFPELRGAVSVEGEGFGAAAIAAIEWIRTCPHLFYWGDIDPAGFEILNGFREAGLPVQSLLMARHDYETYVSYGTLVDARGNPITAGRRRHLQYLTEAETSLYECLTDPAWSRYRRIEQEKIPLKTACDLVLDRLRNSADFR